MMRFNKFQILIFSNIFLCGLNSLAAVSLQKYKDTNEVTIIIEEQIVEEDIAEFNNALEKIGKEKKTLHMNSIQLNSYGGDGSAGRTIGRLIRSKQLNTYVAPNAKCYSACVNILIGGASRFAFGEVAVHRTTFTEGYEIKDEKTEFYVKNDMKLVEQYTEEMRISYLLADAILNTVSWSQKILTEREKREWQVMGTDRVTEERQFTAITKELDLNRKDLVKIYETNYSDCLDEAKKFERTVFECAKTKKVKVNYWNQVKNLFLGLWMKSKN